jgi:ketosteroid isomerase-like protein
VVTTSVAIVAAEDARAIAAMTAEDSVVVENDGVPVAVEAGVAVASSATGTATTAPVAEAKDRAAEARGTTVAAANAAREETAAVENVPDAISATVATGRARKHRPPASAPRSNPPVRRSKD